LIHELKEPLSPLTLKVVIHVSLLFCISIKNGWMLSFLYKKITGWPPFKKYSADLDPRVPVLKFSTLLTVLASKGTDVPPLVINTKGLLIVLLKFE